MASPDPGASGQWHFLERWPGQGLAEACFQGWVCSTHPWKPWRHEDCREQAMPCPAANDSCPFWENGPPGPQ
ncbi:MAG TPA: hypothetical protein VFS62_01575, partial [Chloroflexota bacterium]|nr:hypothetical protein [Chloroflexota bacterium]